MDTPQNQDQVIRCKIPIDRTLGGRGTGGAKIKELAMNKRGLAWFALSILAISLTTVLAQAPLIPFHAKIQRIQQTFGPNGSLEVEESYTDDYTLNSRGSAYTESEVIDSITGQMTGSVKILESASDRRPYFLRKYLRTSKGISQALKHNCGLP